LFSRAQALTGHTVSVGPQEFVAPGRAIATNDVNLKIGIPERGRQIVQKVEYAGVVLANFAGAVVPQIVTQAYQGILIIAFAVPVDDIQAFPSTGMEEMKPVWTIQSGR
jgi:hypothetical protein